MVSARRHLRRVPALGAAILALLGPAAGARASGRSPGRVQPACGRRLGRRQKRHPPRSRRRRRRGRRAEAQKRIVYPISKRVSRYLAASLKLMQANQLPEAEALLVKIAGNRRLNPPSGPRSSSSWRTSPSTRPTSQGAAKHLSEALKSEGPRPGLRAAGDLPAREPVRAALGLPEGDGDPRSAGSRGRTSRRPRRST